MSRVQFNHAYHDIISLENLLEAWKEFIKGKRSRRDVQSFQAKLLDNIIDLHLDLKNKIYEHSEYEAFNISDPKPRSIHKAKVRDRLLHHAIYRKLYPFFDHIFIPDSFSCRINKGTHKALQRFKTFSNKVSKNHAKTVWVLKCDIKKFFASIDQTILLEIVRKYIPDKEITNLISKIISSFHSTIPGLGLPLGNLTSQLLVNIYMNEFDQLIKHKLKAKCYIRYADDFVVLSDSRLYLEDILPITQEFLDQRLRLTMHPHKVFIKTLSSGVDFLGWIHFPDHRVLRTSTKRKMFKNIIDKKGKTETKQSYLGLLEYGNTHKLKDEVNRFMT